MIDITHKSPTLRTAIAQAVLRVSDQATIDAVVNKLVPKGDVLEMARTAGLFAVKKTASMIPDCHPIPIEQTAISYNIEGLEIAIEVQVKTIYRTGVEVEAMHGASVVALTMYDMLKPIDKHLEIGNIKLLNKRGGKSDYKSKYREAITAGVIVCSDSISAGQKQDKAGKAIIAKLEPCGVEVTAYEIIPDEVEIIQQHVLALCDAGNKLVLITGGTGLSPRDVTPEAVRPLLDREIPGMVEAARTYGQQRTPYAMLSRAIAGVRGDTLILTLPGSTGGASETMDALFPAVLHVFGIMKGAAHEVLK